MRTKIILISLFAFHFTNCASQNTEQKGCTKYSKMILGKWINLIDSNQIIEIDAGRIKYYYKKTLEQQNRVIIINQLINCEDMISNYPPSKVRIIEINTQLDTTIHHVISIDTIQMEWASENHDVHWKKL